MSGRIGATPHQEDVGKIAYGEIPAPAWFDVAMLRLRVHENDGGVFAYRAPLIDNKGPVRLYRFLLGGVLFFVKAQDEAMMRDELEDLWLSNEGDMRFSLVPAQPFEEFREAAKLVHSESRLSAFLDRQDKSRR